MTRSAPRRLLTLWLVPTAAVCVVIGMVVGGLGPRAEVRELRARIAELEARPGPRVGTRIFSEVLRPGATGPGGAPEGGPPSAALDPDGRRLDGGAPQPGEAGAAPRDPPTADEVKSALDLRRTQAVAALREQAAADDEQMAQVDQIAAEMNAALHDLASALVTEAAQNPDGVPDRREAMVFAVDALNILLDAEESLWATLDAEQAEGLDPELLDPTAYIDGSIVDVLSQLDQPAAQR